MYFSFRRESNAVSKSPPIFPTYSSISPGLSLILIWVKSGVELGDITGLSSLSHATNSVANKMVNTIFFMSLYLLMIIFTVFV